VTRPDAVPVVSRIFLDCGVTIPAPGEPNGNPNEGWFLTANYPRFVNVVSQSGIEPSHYFNVDFSQAAVLDDTYVDSAYAALNGHRSMFWPYRGGPRPTAAAMLGNRKSSPGIEVDALGRDHYYGAPLLFAVYVYSVTFWLPLLLAFPTILSIPA
jgi:hypothetical protein